MLTLAGAVQQAAPYFSLAGVAAFLVLSMLETVRPAREPGGRLVWRWSSNIVLYLINVFAVPLIFLAGVASHVTDGSRIIAAQPAAIIRWLAGDWGLLIFGFLLCDLLLYIAHRFEHRVRFLWYLHAVHHSDTELDASTGLRHYPLENLLHLIIGAAAFVLLGIPAWVGAAYGVVSYVIGLAQHANLVFGGWGLDWILVTPSMHRVHHSVRQSEHDSNYGNILAIWDHLFGTFRAVSPEQNAAMVFGVDGFRDAVDARPDRVLLQPLRVSRVGSALRVG